MDTAINCRNVSDRWPVNACQVNTAAGGRLSGRARLPGSLSADFAALSESVTVMPLCYWGTEASAPEMGHLTARATILPGDGHHCKRQQGQACQVEAGLWS